MTTGAIRRSNRHHQQTITQLFTGRILFRRQNKAVKGKKSVTDESCEQELWKKIKIMARSLEELDNGVQHQTTEHNTAVRM